MHSAPQVQSVKSAVDQIQELCVLFQQRAEDADCGGAMNDIIRGNLHHLRRMGFFGAAIDTSYGGLGIDERDSRECLKMLAAACGVTAFTQQQLHAGGNFVGLCHDESLKEELLPQFASGKNICGVGFSHLRRNGPPVVVAARTGDGYTINGVIPWISAWTYLDSFILGATIDNGGMLFAYLPIRTFRNSLFATTPMQLSTMEASETVTLEVTDLRLPARYVLSEHGADYMMQYDFRGISGHTEMPLGCAVGSSQYLRSVGLKRGEQQLIAAAESIDDRASAIQDLADLWNGSRFEEPDYVENALAARTRAIKLAVDAAAAAIAATGGSAHLRSSPAQRRYREASFYMTQAQTHLIQHALLERLLNG